MYDSPTGFRLGYATAWLHIISCW